MTRCKVRDDNKWRCIHPADHAGQHSYAYVPTISLPKMQMALLRQFRKMLKDIESGIVKTDEYDILESLRARRELIDSIVELEKMGRERSDEFVRRQVYAP